MNEPRRAAEFPNKRFWAVLDERHPEERSRRVMNPPFFWHRHVPDLALVITMFVSPDTDRCGVFLGTNRKVGAVNISKRMSPHAARINATLALDPADSSEEFPFVSRWNVNCYAEDNWPPMVDWMVTEASRYERVLGRILADRTA